MWLSSGAYEEIVRQGGLQAAHEREQRVALWVNTIACYGVHPGYAWVHTGRLQCPFAAKPDVFAINKAYKRHQIGQQHRLLDSDRPFFAHAPHIPHPCMPASISREAYSLLECRSGQSDRNLD